MKIYHYTKCNRLNSIFEDGFIATEKKRNLSKVITYTNYVWLTEKKSYPKTAMPALSIFPETIMSNHLAHKNIYVDLDKIGKVFGNFYRFSFDSTDTRIKKWFWSDERKKMIGNASWMGMESIANKVGDDVRCFWIATDDLVLENFGLEVYENGGWRELLSDSYLSNLTDEEKTIISEHRAISVQKCRQFGITPQVSKAA